MARQTGRSVTTLRDRALQVAAPQGERAPDARRARSRPPAGFEPGVKFDPKTGTGELVTEPRPADEPIEWAGVFAHFGLDADQYAIVGPVEMRSWESWSRDVGDDGELGPTSTRWLYYYKARFELRGESSADRQSIDDLVESVARDRRVSKLSVGDAALVVNLADWQAGKRDGDGTHGLIERARATIVDMRRRVVELRRIGVPVGTIYVAGLGDLVEGCDGHYAMQCFGVELNRRDQRKLARRLIKEIVKAASRLVESVVVVAVGGNHGENRKDGKAFTSFADNDDVSIFEEIAEALDENPDAYGHVSFVLPDADLTVTLDVAGTIVTWAHGHQFRGGATAEIKARKWLADQALGKTPAGDCDLLITGHYHHYRAAQWGAVAWLQCPALDGGSEWWRQLSGEHSPPGTLSVVVGSSVGARGWGHELILGETYVA